MFFDFIRPVLSKSLKRSPVRLVFVLVILFTIACSEDQGPVKNSPQFELSHEEISIGSEGSASVINVVSDTYWSIDFASDWISPNVSDGNGNFELEIEILPNDSQLERSDTLTFVSNGLTLFLKVFQEGGTPPVLMDYLGKDSIPRVYGAKFLTFNEPIDFLFIRNVDESPSFFLQPEDVSLLDNDKRVEFSGTPNLLGRDYLIEYSVKNRAGVVLTDTVRLNYYSRKYVVQGQIVDQMVAPNGLVWVLTQSNHWIKNVDRVLAYSPDEGSLKTIKDLDHSPLKVVFNPYNGLYYMIYSDHPIIDIFNDSWEKVDELSFEPDSYDFAGEPSIYPQALGFTQSGNGIISLRARDTGPRTWKYIDSTSDHSLSALDWNNDELARLKIVDLKPNYNYSALIIVETPEVKARQFTDEKSIHTIPGLERFDVFRPNTMVMHKRENKAYVGKLYDNFVFDFDANRDSNLHIRDRLGGEFTYIKGKEDIMYLFEVVEYYVLIISNFKTGEVYQTIPFGKDYVDFGTFTKFLATTDGRNLVQSTKVSSDGTQSFFIAYDSRMFFSDIN